MKTSIIIPVYNVAPYLEKCLSSCMNQTFRDIEIIVVNDGSTDSSLQIIEAYAAKDDRIVVIDKKQNEGLIYARKSGIEAARGEYLFHLDADDFISERAIEILYKEAEDKEADLVIGGFLFLETNGESRYGSMPTFFQGIAGQDLVYERLKSTRCSIWGELIRKELYDGLIFVPITRGEDYYQMMQFCLKVKKTAIVYEPLYYYSIRPGGITQNTKKEVVSTQYYEFIVAVSSLLDTGCFERRIVTNSSCYLLRCLFDFCYNPARFDVRHILKSHFFKDKEVRHELWITDKVLFFLCYVGLFPWLYKFLKRISNRNSRNI